MTVEWELEDPPSDIEHDPTFSDDIQGLHEVETETTLLKNHQGIVIQHRHGALGDCFRSEDDRSFGLPSSQPLQFRSDSINQTTTEHQLDGLDAMTDVSSPARMPFALSDTSILKRKRSSTFNNRSPLKEVLSNASSYQPAPDLFQEVSEDEDDELPVNHTIPTKRRRLSESVYPSLPSPVTKPPSLNMDEAKDNDQAFPDLGSSLLTRGASALSRNALTARSTSLHAVQTSRGRQHDIRHRTIKPGATYEQLAAARSTTANGKAQRSYYGIDIHRMLEDAEAESALAPTSRLSDSDRPVPSNEYPSAQQRATKSMLWTEKYRARKFTDLIGDDRTHRQVMHWLKSWDQIVFPGSKPKPKPAKQFDDQEITEKTHRKVMLLTGPPGLGKTTLAHVCARQAGYEVQEINASDERSKEVVRGRIRDMVGTENVRQASTKHVNGAKSVRHAARPVCVIVDEVDGAVSGASGSGEGGFIKALIDLLALDQRNIDRKSYQQDATTTPAKGKKGDSFRMLRPLVLICNDVYHPALRPLRQSAFAEIVHVGKPALDHVAVRLGTILKREGVPADGDAVRRLCEASWGVTSRKEGSGGQSTGEGDIRSVMVMAEWAAGRFRGAETGKTDAVARLTRRWLDDVFFEELSRSGGAARGLGRGGAREIVDRIFQEGAGLSKATSQGTQEVVVVNISGVKGVAEAAKSRAMQRLREMVDSAAESDKIMTECFTLYPEQPFHDDTMLSKPATAYDWLHFHDVLSSAVFQTNEWELAPYLSQPALAFHHLFATSKAARTRYGSWTDAAEQLPLSGPQASFAAHEAQKANTAILQSLQSNLSLPLIRFFSTVSTLATDLTPFLSRILSPCVNPVLISGSGEQRHATTASVRRASEKLLIARAVNGLLATGTSFEKMRLDQAVTSATHQARHHAGWIYRMEPALDVYGVFATAEKMSNTDVSAQGQRYAVRQILDQEVRRVKVKLDAEARQRRFEHGGAGRPVECFDKETESQGPRLKAKAVKRDFFGREIVVAAAGELEEGQGRRGSQTQRTGRRVWVSYHEGSSNAVRKPISLAVLMKEFT